MKLESASKTRPSRESLEQVADDDFREQLQLSVQTWKVEVRIQDVSVHYDDTELALRRRRAKGQDSKFSCVHWTWIGWFECRQVVSRLEVQILGTQRLLFDPNGAR